MSLTSPHIIIYYICGTGCIMTAKHCMLIFLNPSIVPEKNFNATFPFNFSIIVLNKENYSNTNVIVL